MTTKYRPTNADKTNDQERKDRAIRVLEELVCDLHGPQESLKQQLPMFSLAMRNIRSRVIVARDLLRGELTAED